MTSAIIIFMEYPEYYKTENGGYIRNYVNRPNINIKKTIRVILTIFVCNAIISCLLSLLLYRFFQMQYWHLSVLIFAIIQLCICVLLIKRIMIFTIRLYQRYAKIETRMKCCFKPSCSEYAVLALQKHGVIKGIKLSINRFKRCHPPGGEDYP